MDSDTDRTLAWLELRQTAATLEGELSRRLEATAGMSASEYDVLWYLANAVDRRMTMSELAGRLVITASGTTRLVDRLVRQGWVSREVGADNRRVTYAVLTGTGTKAARRGYRTVREVRQELFDQRLEDAEVDELRRVLGKLLRRLDLTDTSADRQT